MPPREAPRPTGRGEAPRRRTPATAGRWSSTALASQATTRRRAVHVARACRAGTTASTGVPSRPRPIRSRSWDAPIPALFEFVLANHDEHRLTGRTHHRDEEPQRDIGAVVGVRIVDDVAAWLPERLTGLDHPRRFAFQLEEHLAFQHVAERRPAGVA